MAMATLDRFLQKADSTSEERKAWTCSSWKSVPRPMASSSAKRVKTEANAAQVPEPRTGPRVKNVNRPAPVIEQVSDAEHPRDDSKAELDVKPRYGAGKDMRKYRSYFPQCSLYAELPEDWEPALLPLQSLITLCQGKVFFAEETAKQMLQEAVHVPRFIAEHSTFETGEIATWAHQICLDMAANYPDYDDRHYRFAVFPDPPPYAHNQRQESFEETLQRFYGRGLLPIAQHTLRVCNLEELMALGLQKQDWKSLIAQNSENKRDEVNIWRLLWITGAELVEWYLVRGAYHYQCFGEAFYAERCGRSQDEQQPDDELSVLRDIVQCWSLLKEHTPSACLPSKRAAAEAVKTYVFTHLQERLECLQDQRRSKGPPPRPVRALPQLPQLGDLLRTPQQDRIPPGWSWKRQVRTRRGTYFGVQDILFFASWEDNFQNHNRHRSYNEIEEAIGMY